MTKPEIPAEPAGEPAEPLPEPCQREEAEMGCSGFSRPVEGQRKPLELVGIVVDVPRLRAMDDMGSGPPGGNRFEYSGNRVFSLKLKRIWSI